MFSGQAKLSTGESLPSLLRDWTHLLIDCSGEFYTFVLVLCNVCELRLSLLLAVDIISFAFADSLAM